jgi:prepilin-type processing-associated H-X9-DG protein
MTRSLTTLAIGLAFLATLLAVPVRAQQPTMASLLTGNALPLTVKLGNITTDWRKFSLVPLADIKATADEYTRRSEMDIIPLSVLFAWLNTYYTQGQTITLHEVPYLIAYGFSDPDRERTMNTLIYNTISNRYTGSRQSGLLSVMLTKETELSLCLLNLNATGMLLNIAQANLDDEFEYVAQIQQQAVLQEQQRASATNLRQCAVAVLMYCQDHEMILPDIEAYTALAKEHPTVWWRHPATNDLYRYNLGAAGKPLREFHHPDMTPLVYEATPWPDGSRTIAYLDGHVQRVSAKQWEQLQAEWGLQ